MDVNCPKGGRHELDFHDMDDWHCRKCCKYVLTNMDVLALANAAMQLTAEEARAAEELVGADQPHWKEYDESKRLLAYAEAWPK